METSICDNSTVMMVLRIVRISILAICIIVPIIMIVTTMIKYMSTIKAGDGDDIKKANKSLVIKAIAVACIFMIPTMVNLIIRVTVGDETYKSCLDGATIVNINKAKYNEAAKLVEYAEETLELYAYGEAKTAVSKLKNESEKNELNKRLDIVNEAIQIKELVSIAELKPNRENYNKAKEAVDKLPNGKLKDKLLERLKEVSKKLAPDYSYNPGDYSGKNLLRGKSISVLLKENGSSIEEFNAIIKENVEAAGVGTRQAVINAGVTLIGELAKYGYALPYQWGGKYSGLGAKSIWGSVGSAKSCDSYAARYGESARSGCEAQIYESLDCSGFVGWAIRNGFQNTSLDQQSTSVRSGDTYLSGKTSAICQPGDVLVNGGHIVLVIGIDEENKKYQVAESSGSVKISTKKFNESGYYCRKLNNLYHD